MATGKTKRMDRRRFIKSLAGAAGGVGTTWLVNACGTPQSGSTSQPTPNALSGATPSTAEEATPVVATAAATTETGSGAQQPVTVAWGGAGNPDELKRDQEFFVDFHKRHPNITIDMRLLQPGEYGPKILSQLAAGTAPDLFVVDGAFLVKLIKNGMVAKLNDYLARPESPVKESDFVENLWGGSKAADGGIYGLPIASNAMVLWYNKAVLREAGITELPADLHTQGKWSRDVFDQMVMQVTAKGKRGYILGGWWAHLYSWVTASGGTIYRDGRFVLHEDAKAIEAVKWLYDRMQKKQILYAAGLPRGQNDSGLFASNQLAFASAGRWLLPTFSTTPGLEYDIVPFPSTSGEKFPPVALDAAQYAMNKDTKHPDETFLFIAESCSKIGATFLLSGPGGNSLPSIKGADDVVLAGSNPEHAQFFLDSRDHGWVLFQEELKRPGLTDDIISKFEPLWTTGGDVDAFLKEVGDMVNTRLATPE